MLRLFKGTIGDNIGDTIKLGSWTQVDIRAVDFTSQLHHRIVNTDTTAGGVVQEQVNLTRFVAEDVQGQWLVPVRGNCLDQVKRKRE